MRPENSAVSVLQYLKMSDLCAVLEDIPYINVLSLVIFSMCCSIL